jgi:hypothetical protein
MLAVGPSDKPITKFNCIRTSFCLATIDCLSAPSMLSVATCVICNDVTGYGTDDDDDDVLSGDDSTGSGSLHK